MHLFLYQAERHHPRQGYYGRRLSQSTIRCDFDLDLLKRGIKGRYQILGHSVHDFQKALLKLDMERDFYGHVIAIEEPRNAVWFKLNYDQIGRHITKYIGGWKDLEASDLESHIEEYRNLKSKKASYERSLQNMRGNFYTMNTFLARIESDIVYPDFSDVSDSLKYTWEEGKKFRETLVASEKKVEAICESLSQKMLSIQDTVRSYMDSRKL